MWSKPPHGSPLISKGVTTEQELGLSNQPRSESQPSSSLAVCVLGHLVAFPGAPISSCARRGSVTPASQSGCKRVTRMPGTVPACHSCSIYVGSLPPQRWDQSAPRVLCPPFPPASRRSTAAVRREAGISHSREGRKGQQTLLGTRPDRKSVV